MTDESYLPSPSKLVRDQVAEFETSGGATVAPETGLAIIVLTTVGARTRRVRKTPLMRVEHEGCYLLVASNDGKPVHPAWYHNLVVHPTAFIQDGAVRFEVRVRELAGEEYEEWLGRATTVYPPYVDYRRRAGRRIPLLLAQGGAVPLHVQARSCSRIPLGAEF